VPLTAGPATPRAVRAGCAPSYAARCPDTTRIQCIGNPLVSPHTDSFDLLNGKRRENAVVVNETGR
jgi:hypothetical protein